MIIWLNGTFGAGKTTTSAILAASLPDARVFDSEKVGELLVPILRSHPVRDFQDWPPWRPLVVHTAAQVLDYVGGTLVVPQTVLVERYWDEIDAGLAAAGIPVRHFVLHADHETLVRRIESDPLMPGSQWRLDHLRDYHQALPWLQRKGRIIDTSQRPPDEVAALIERASCPPPPAVRG
ncbi:MAG TPA: AAA family ATPase [Actinophytocola sp.]|nr:AAA family ATPase [Actinophytocola sp.]